MKELLLSREIKLNATEKAVLRDAELSEDKVTSETFLTRLRELLFARLLRANEKARGYTYETYFTHPTMTLETLAAACLSLDVDFYELVGELLAERSR